MINTDCNNRSSPFEKIFLNRWKKPCSISSKARGGNNDSSHDGVCKETALTDPPQKGSCDERRIPNVKREKNSRHIFDERTPNWIKAPVCLKNAACAFQKGKHLWISACRGKIPSRNAKKCRQKNRRRCASACKLEKCKLENGVAYLDWESHFSDEALSGNHPYVRSPAPMDGMETA